MRKPSSGALRIGDSRSASQRDASHPALGCAKRYPGCPGEAGVNPERVSSVTDQQRARSNLFKVANLMMRESQGSRCAATLGYMIAIPLGWIHQIGQF